MKKFWKKVSIKKISSDSFCVMLDKGILKTPLKRDLVLPNLNLAQEIVKEWDQDSKKINTESMIFYGLISTSLDKIIDDKGHFEADDEIGFFFDEIKQLGQELDNLFETEVEDGNKEEEKKKE